MGSRAINIAFFYLFLVFAGVRSTHSVNNLNTNNTQKLTVTHVLSDDNRFSSSVVSVVFVSVMTNNGKYGRRATMMLMMIIMMLIMMIMMSLIDGAPNTLPMETE